MKIGKATQPRSAICTSNADTIVVRGADLSRDLIGHINFGDYWKRYRETHPEQPERTRDLQKVRNKRRHSRSAVKMDASTIAKMDAIKVIMHPIPVT